jgi:hypothetical protein
MRLKKEKCFFISKSVEYLGQLEDEDKKSWTSLSGWMLPATSIAGLHATSPLLVHC